MRFYTRQHRFYCGVDLHARSMYVCVLDQEGNVLVSKDIPTAPEVFLWTKGARFELFFSRQNKSTLALVSYSIAPAYRATT
jgi:hypothetical protein